jgi:hypothetical protein
MKRLPVFLLILAIFAIGGVATDVVAKMRIKQYRLAASSTSTVTLSFLTTYGFQPTEIVAWSPDGDFTLKIHGVGGRAGMWAVVRAGGMPFVISKNKDFPIDTVLVVPSAASGNLDINAYGAE